MKAASMELHLHVAMVCIWDIGVPANAEVTGAPALVPGEPDEL